MAVWRSTVRHGRLAAGDRIEIPDHELALWDGPIEAGFLVREAEPMVEDGFVDAGPAPWIAPEGIGTPEDEDTDPGEGESEAVERPDPTRVIDETVKDPEEQ